MATQDVRRIAEAVEPIKPAIQKVYRDTELVRPLETISQDIQRNVDAIPPAEPVTQKVRRDVESIEPPKPVTQRLIPEDVGDKTKVHRPPRYVLGTLAQQFKRLSKMQQRRSKLPLQDRGRQENRINYLVSRMENRFEREQRRVENRQRGATLRGTDNLPRGHPLEKHKRFQEQRKEKQEDFRNWLAAGKSGLSAQMSAFESVGGRDDANKGNNTLLDLIAENTREMLKTLRRIEYQRTG
jgi:hypothetical protein